MKKIIFAACAALVLTACRKQQAETPETQPVQTEGLKVAYIEVDSLMSQYQFCKDYNILLNKKGENAQRVLADKQRTLQNHAAALQNTTRDEVERAQNQLTREQQDLAELEQRLMTELANEQANLTAEMRDSIQAFLRVYNKSKKFDYILSRSGDNILMANPQYDITEDVVRGLNKRYKVKPEVKEKISAE